MRTIKIVLTIAVIATIGFFIVRGIVNIEPPDEVRPSTNCPFIERIEKKIDSLSHAPVSAFSTTLRDQITFDIAAFHRQGSLGESESSNNQWKEILSRNLFSTYASKFVEQAMHVFGGSEWRDADLRFIRSEVAYLKRSEFFDPTANFFNGIDAILAKYDEISRFIATSNNFSFSNFELSARFPVSDVNQIISRSRTYLNNLNSGSDMAYRNVNNNIRLRNSLNAIPQNLFNRHIAYLRTKIQQHASSFRDFDSQPDYSNTVFTPLRTQIDALNNDVYRIDNAVFQRERNSLTELLSSYNLQATNYFRELEQERRRLEETRQQPPQGTPAATIQNVRVERNVTENGQRGMRIFVSFNVDNMLGRSGIVAAWFSHSDGRRLTDSQGGNFRTPDGQVTVQRNYSPPYQNTRYTDFALFLPYSALGISSNVRTNLRFHIGIFDHNRTQLVTSGFTNFTN